MASKRKHDQIYEQKVEKRQKVYHKADIMVII